MSLDTFTLSNESVWHDSFKKKVKKKASVKITVSENSEFELVREATKKYVLMIVPLRGGGGGWELNGP